MIIVSVIISNPCDDDADGDRRNGDDATTAVDDDSDKFDDNHEVVVEVYLAMHMKYPFSNLCFL